MKSVIILLVFSFVPFAEAQHSAYANLKDRPVKALSEQQLLDYRAGAGMGLALAAELNQYPGPKHVLELAETLALSDEQSAQVRSAFDAMRGEAIRLGEQVIQAEAALDAAFAGGSIDVETREVLTTSIATLQSRLRFVHLRAHLETRAVLTRHQRMMYEQLRGYSEGHEHAHSH
jgi:Spy/CpxP family protein refolding chaperone